MYQDRNMMPPVKVGEEVKVTIEAVGEKGDGLCKVKNFIVFVPGTRKGEHVKIRITKVFNKMGFGEVVEKIEKPAKEKRDVIDISEPEPVIPEPSAEDSEDFGEGEVKEEPEVGSIESTSEDEVVVPKPEKE